MLNEENLVATLEESLRQTRNAQNRFLGRLREVEAESSRSQNEIEASKLRNEIEALGNSAKEIEQAIYSILAMQK